MLIGTDNIVVAVFASKTGGGNHVRYQMNYRYRVVDTIEYVGIVQSQQG
jgi:hypothetical protein